jgi:uncharacterized membrane protein
MANIVSKNVEKGVNNTVVVAIASLLAMAAQQGAKQIGLDIDSSQMTVIITAGLSGIIAAIQNWYSHRQKVA